MPNPEKLRIIYAGTPDFAVPPLQRLFENDFKPLAVLSQPDRPAGRGRKLQASPVKIVAQAANIPVYQPVSLRDPAIVERLASLRPDLVIVVAYGLILPKTVLDLPVQGCWNIHASLLPRWRGAAPIQRAIEAGDDASGVCIMQMEEGLDTGPVLQQCRVTLTGNETGGSLHDRLALAGADALLSCIGTLQSGTLPKAVNQAAEGITYARKLMKSEALIDWSEAARVLERRVRAFNPWPVAWCNIAGERTRIWSAEVVPKDHHRAPGTVLSAGKTGIDIATGQQVLRLLELQKPGGRRVTAAEYLNARQLPVCLEN
jgi:methionyl-tRNA formyltransferase